MKKRRVVFKSFLLFFLVVFLVLLGTGAYAYYTYDSAKTTVNDDMHESVKNIDETKAPDTEKKPEPINVLLMGVDERPDDPGRSDALIVLTLNPQKDAMQMVSIPRDTRTTIVGKGYKDKINHSYAFGGTNMTVGTVENFTDAEMDYYVKINMQGLPDVVDAVGGITVHNTLDWHDEGYYKKGYHYKKGDIHLNGEQTIGFVRMRHKDPNGDFGRNKRQRKVIEAIIDKGASFSSVTRVQDILSTLGDNVKTNMAFDNMKNLFLNYRNARQNVKQYEVQGNGTKINGIYYLQVPQKERQKVHQMIGSMNQTDAKKNMNASAAKD
ncbi:LCP family glycopolymer transferase [Tuberibacillus sp. Marseille-P3662]|uniref:LCP family glycopolymer transferase n=1 Tax=Tuberibacillus sp. Marseille-P3662 TaxID=1965358 RepID=UPI00111BEC7C|nr:LCP family protein [Tuberibacillus sp. Marseille-P3662]